MARRRLYGETQKRRKKIQTVKLKRSRSTERVTATHLPAPFERAGEVNRQDMDFLEAMRDLQIVPNQRRPYPPARLKKMDQVRFAADAEAADDFMRAMDNLGVEPLDGRPRPHAADSASSHDLRPAAVIGRHSRPSDHPGNVGSEAANMDGKPAAEPSDVGAGRAHKDRQISASQPAPPEIVQISAQEGGIDANRPPSPVRFVEEPEVMAALNEGEFDPAQKYEGAPQPASRGNRKGRSPKELPGRFPEEPDGVLDLHGYDREMAARKLESYIVACQGQRLRHVLVITGKGHNSGDRGPVLREMVQRWLEGEGRRYTQNFCWAPPRHGGEGAIWVWLQ
ncbi:MAG: Smr/MutS family protein [SAR324 cluster bacterium]|nr:Smr/MutS family protein [SAR324 cluster bacterium]